MHDGSAAEVELRSGQQALATHSSAVPAMAVEAAGVLLEGKTRGTLC